MTRVELLSHLVKMSRWQPYLPLILLLLLPHPQITFGTPLASSEKVFRILRDVTGAYHPEHERHDHGHQHDHGHNHGTGENDIRGQHQFNQFDLANGGFLTTENLNLVSGDGSNALVASTVNSIVKDAVANAQATASASASSSSGGDNVYYVVPPPASVPCTTCGTGDGHGGYGYPPAPNPDQIPNCGCVPAGRCLDDHAVYTRELLSQRTIELVCGLEFSVCCPRDPWPGTKDEFAHLLPCAPKELCVRAYGTSPLDVAEYGAIGPCPGQGAVRCIDILLESTGQPVTPYVPAREPERFTIPIVSTLPEEPQQPQTPMQRPQVPVQQPQKPVQPTEPKVTPSAPAEKGYVYPPPPPPPPVVTYKPPTPVVTYKPPTPVVTYKPPTPQPPPVTYAPPKPVPPPVTSYAPPKVVPEVAYENFVEPEAPVDAPIAPVAPIRAVAPYYPGGGFYGGLGNYYGGFGLYPGFGFHKRFHFSKGFGLGHGLIG